MTADSQKMRWISEQYSQMAAGYPRSIPPRILPGPLRGPQLGIGWFTNMVSSPITWISFQQMTISSSCPNTPRHLGRP